MTDARFSDTLLRFHHQNELDAIIGTWTSQRGHYEVMQILQNVGAAAGLVLNVAEVLADPHMKAREAFQWVSYPDFTFPVCVPPWRSQGLTKYAERACPDFGENNEKLLTDVLGMIQAETDSPLEKEVIVKAPIPLTTLR